MLAAHYVLVHLHIKMMGCAYCSFKSYKSFYLLIASRPSVFISGDACFTQKREHDPNRSHDPALGDPVTQDLFIFHEDCNQMEAYEIHSKMTPKGTPTPNLHSPHVHEIGVAIPNKELNLCGESYNAANEQHAKASGTFFEDTGIMALICHHDHIIFLANLTTPGE
jgi:Kyakuja-Dileera-Zisupton transposase